MISVTGGGASSELATPSPTEAVDTGIRKTVRWHLDHQGRVDREQSGTCREWVAENHAER